MTVIILNNFLHEVNVSVCSAQWDIFLITCVFDIMQFGNMLQFFFNCSYRCSTSYQPKLLNIFRIGHLPAQNKQ